MILKLERNKYYVLKFGDIKCYNDYNSSGIFRINPVIIMKMSKES